MDTREAWSGEPTLETIDGVPTWVWPSGERLRLLAGGAPDGDDGGDDAGDGDAGGDDGGDGDGDGAGDGDAGGDDDDEPLGDAGKKTLKREREWREKAEKSKKAADRKVKELEKKLAAAEAGKGTDEEKKIAEASTAAAKAEREKLAGQLRRSAIRTAAAGKMDPDLAARLVDAEDIDVDDEGEVDESAAKKAVEQLLEAHPELALKTPGRKSGGDPQGGKGGGNGKPDMNELLRAAATGR